MRKLSLSVKQPTHSRARKGYENSSPMTIISSARDDLQRYHEKEAGTLSKINNFTPLKAKWVKSMSKERRTLNNKGLVEVKGVSLERTTLRRLHASGIRPQCLFIDLSKLLRMDSEVEYYATHRSKTGYSHYKS